LKPERFKDETSNGNGGKSLRSKRGLIVKPTRNRMETFLACSSGGQCDQTTKYMMVRSNVIELVMFTRKLFDAKENMTNIGLEICRRLFVGSETVAPILPLIESLLIRDLIDIASTSVGAGFCACT
jgi:hypothetical protein